MKKKVYILVDATCAYSPQAIKGVFEKFSSVLEKKYEMQKTEPYYKDRYKIIHTTIEKE
jgi:hypothetical protein